jgi:hypothetical protein
MKTYNEEIGKTKNGVTIFRRRHEDTEKNLSYIEKRKKLGEEMTAKLGVTCFG